MTVRDAIIRECDAIKALLLRKNADYGDSALKPLRCLSSADAAEGLRVRIDDKLKRMQNLRGRRGRVREDTLADLIGYLVLLRIAERDVGEPARRRGVGGRAHRADR